MPSLIRFIATIGILAGLAYGAMYALVLYVEPTKREMTERVPTDKINPIRQTPQTNPALQTTTDSEDSSTN